MSSHHPSYVTAALLSLFPGVVACGGGHAEAPPSHVATNANTGPAPAAAGRSPVLNEEASRQPDTSQDDDNDEAELVVSRDVVVACPKLSLVRRHVAELDPDMIWVDVLDSLADCMSSSGPLAQQSIGVSGDEEHRHVVREVLGSRGIAPTRIVATKTSVQGAAECQGQMGCSKRVEISIAPAP